MTSKRKQRTKGFFHDFLLRTEEEHLNRARNHRARRAARKQIRKEDDALSSALSSVSVSLENTAPKVGAPLRRRDRDSDVKMQTRERSGRIRKSCNKCRERRSRKLRERLTRQSSMSGVVKAVKPDKPAKSVTFASNSTK